METKKQPHWLRGLRPLFWWLGLVLILYAYQTHRRLSEQTRIVFQTSLENRPENFEGNVTLDGQPYWSLMRVSLGRHNLVIADEKAESFSTNFFVWYGQNDLGAINLKRRKGTLSVKAASPATLISIDGPELHLKLTNSSGTTITVPTDHYTIKAVYRHWNETKEIAVGSAATESVTFSPRLAVVQLTCNQTGATFQIQGDKGRLLESGELPKDIADVPEGNYKLITWHHGHRTEQALNVKFGVTNNAQVQFLYGSVRLETDPPRATIRDADGASLGVTPETITELSVGTKVFQLQLDGHENVMATLNIADQQTTTFRTNLININYTKSIDAAQQYLTGNNLDAALRSVTNALESKPNDMNATVLGNQVRGKMHVRRANEFAKQGDYLNAVKELEAGLGSFPGDEDAKRLLIEFRPLSAQQTEHLRTERLERPKKEFESMIKQYQDADLFEVHELKFQRPVNEIPGLLAYALQHGNPAFAVKAVIPPDKQTFAFDAKMQMWGTIRRCLIVGGQINEGETEIFFKVMEYKMEAVNKLSIGALISNPTEEGSTLVPLHSSRINPLSDRQQAQVKEGVELLEDRIRSAIKK